MNHQASVTRASAASAQIHARKPAGELTTNRVRAIQDHFCPMFCRNDGRTAGMSVSLREVQVAGVFTQRGAHGQVHDQAIVRVFSARFDELDRKPQSARSATRQVLDRGRQRSLDRLFERSIDIAECDLGASHDERQMTARRVDREPQRSRALLLDARSSR